MTLSLSPSIRPFVTKEFFSSLKSFNGVSRKSKGCLKFEGCFKEGLRVFIKNFKGLSKKFKGCFKEVSRVFQRS